MEQELKQRIRLAKKRLRGLPTNSGHYIKQRERIAKLEERLEAVAPKPIARPKLEAKKAPATRKRASRKTKSSE